MSGILSLSTSCIFDFWMKTSKTTIIATVKINKKDRKMDIPIATRYWSIKPRFSVTCLDSSKPPRIAFKPLAIKKIDKIKPEESKPE